MLGYNSENDWNRMRTYWHDMSISSHCIYLLKKEWKEVFLTLVKYLVKPIKNTWNRIMLTNQEKIYYVFDENNLYGLAMS